MSNEIDILNEMNSVDLSKVETGFPLLASGVVKTNIVKCEMRRDVEKKGDSAKPYCYVEYTLSQPWKTSGHDGPVKEIAPGGRGATFNERVYIGKYNDKNTGEEKWYGLDRVLLLREAVFGRKINPGEQFNPTELIGQEVQVRLKFEPAPVNKDTKEVYGPRTSVDGYVKKKA